MASAFNQSSSTSGPISSGQSTTVTSIPTHQMLNHTLPVKLDRSNYVLWRSQIDYVVFVNGFEDFIDGTTICPEKELSLGIIGYNTSHTAWNALEKTFSFSSKARIMQLRLELQSMKKGSLSMIDYIMKVKGAADNLAAIGEPVLEQDQIMNLLRGLKSDYNTVVTAINIRDDKIFIEAVHSMLLTFEHRLEQQSSIDLVLISACHASSSNNRGGGRKYNYNGRHNSTNSEKPQCQLCGKFGHTAYVCYHRFDISYQTSQNNGTPSLNTGNHNTIPVMVATSHNSAGDDWYFHSGASHHLTQNEGNLNNFAPYTSTDRVTVGNGSAYEEVASARQT
ncbi:hypothetical protein POTOM_001417 [Populus tomentosa]|uniref:Retrovirus-related Pol polyprotein from transposon RE1 n=1 Tax=Populus tomentosa TaxID=118781 RepID=A0A8X8IY22_POPTO|nr:hypothetical protein POTOM_001417 [Populus tomentosa]